MESEKREISLGENSRRNRANRLRKQSGSTSFVGYVTLTQLDGAGRSIPGTSRVYTVTITKSRHSAC